MANDRVTGDGTRAKPVVRRMLLSFVIIAVSGYAGLCLLLLVVQNALIFFPTREVLETPAANRWEFESVSVSVDRFETTGWFVPAPGNARGTVLLSHGNAGNIGDRLVEIQPFRDLGFNTLIYDYGGYGESTGKPSESRCYDDARAMYRWLRDVKKIPPERIVLFGRSLGSGPTTQLATEVECGAVILESAFRSVPRIAGEIYPWLPTRLLARTRFDNESKVARIRVPVLVAHSPDDTIIPFSHGRALFDAVGEPKSFLEFRGDHNEGFWLDSGNYMHGLDQFFEQHFDGEE